MQQKSRLISQEKAFNFNFKKGVEINKIFPEASEFLGENFGYYTLYYEGGNFFVYSMIQNDFDSITLEHGF